MAVLFAYLVKVLADDVQDEGFLSQDGPVAFDFLGDIGIFLGELFDFQAGEALQLHLENGVGLSLAEEMVLRRFFFNEVRGQELLESLHLG